MNAPALRPIGTVQRMPRERYQGWRILSKHDAQPYALPAFDTVEEAAAHMAGGWDRGEQFVILATEIATGRMTQHIFEVRQQARPVGFDAATGRNLYKRYAAPIASLRVSAFAPVEPWRAGQEQEA